MGVDHELVCLDCNETLYGSFRNWKIVRHSRELDSLEQFMFRHADHHLTIAHDDSWSRTRPGYTVFEHEPGTTAQRARSDAVWDQLEIVDGRWVPKGTHNTILAFSTRKDKR